MDHAPENASALQAGIFALWDAIPFGVDTWPDCLPWERAGRPTRADLDAIDDWAKRARLHLALEIDRRFDAIEDWLQAAAWPGVE